MKNNHWTDWKDWYLTRKMRFDASCNEVTRDVTCILARLLHYNYEPNDAKWWQVLVVKVSQNE